ncbi:MAG: polyphosphate polymerase domain-containing protein [Eubacteriales bacterium]|nr:polyphosphate polymerase domain-containing protein [Eubacteriales bacterium]
MATPWRHELKHLINRADVMALSSRLAAVIPRDSHAGPDGRYRVRSLYFDNYRDAALNEKIDGLSEREKFRLRFYGDNCEWIRLEKKIKLRNLCGKQSTRVSREETMRIIAGDTNWLLSDQRPVLQDLGAKMQGHLLRPKTIVEYQREAFIYGPGNVRITLDSEIRSGLHSLAFFDQNQPLVLTDLQGLTVLEVKYDAYLPDIVRDIIQLGERQVGAMSKYAASRIFY